MFFRDKYNILVENIPEPYFPTSLMNNRKKLREYQFVGRNWLYEGRRRWLTDKPGLGKTLQASEAVERPCLVVAPTYLTRQWYDFLTEQYPNDTVSYATGVKLNRFQRQKALDQVADWYIVNTQMMRVDDYGVPNFTMPDCKTVIYDEAHHLRNRKAKQSIGAALYAADEERRVYSLTATPMWKDAGDLWMQLHITQPEIFDNYRDFIDAFCVVDDTPYGPKILGTKKAMRQELRRLLYAVSLGRTYKDVGRHLPSIIKDTFKIDFPTVLRDKYDELKELFRIQIEEDETLIFSSYISVMHSLRTLTNFQDKQQALIDRMSDVGKPGVVFVWYKDVAYELGDLIPNSVVLTGDIEPEERQRQALQAMKSGKNVIATMSSLSEGVNLYDYRYVAFYECDYPPGRNEQTLGRVVRDRNDDGADQEPVIVDYFMVADTIDEVIYKVSQRREATIKDVMGEVLR